MKQLVDSSAWIEVLRPKGDEDTRRAVEDAVRAGDAVLCDMVLLELWAGAGGNHERAVIAGLEADLEILTIGKDVWREAFALARLCRAAGITVPASDLVIAACADHHGAEIVARDEHFGQIDTAQARRGGSKSGR